MQCTVAAPSQRGCSCISQDEGPRNLLPDESEVRVL